MKERTIYSPKNEKQDNNLDINFKKSPQKFILYDSPQPPTHLPPNNSEPEISPSNNLESIRKVPD